MNDVWVLYREGRDTVLIIGAFSAASTALEYVQSQQKVDNNWQPPRPGKWRWEMETKDFRYVIERHEVRGPAPFRPGHFIEETEHGSF